MDSILTGPNTGQNIAGARPQRISDISEVSAESHKDTKRQHQPQFAHPAATWQKIQKYLLPYRQTMEQLHPSGCDTSKFILNTPSSKTDKAGLKGSTII